jgi:RNA polymerase sigma factor (TIGR02999 family)
MARSHLSRHAQLQASVQPTALVHDAYLKLIAQDQVNWESRAQFFGLASKVMRDLLVDYVRRNQAGKRGGGELTITLSQADRLGHRTEIDVAALDEALKELAKIKPRHSRIVELRFFGGLTIEETALVLNISHATVEREWQFARAWLRKQLEK